MGLGSKRIRAFFCKNTYISYVLCGFFAKIQLYLQSTIVKLTISGRGARWVVFRVQVPTSHKLILLIMIKWQLKKVNLNDIKEYPKNPRKSSDREERELKESIDKFGLIDKPIVNADMTLIGGHLRKRILESEGATECEAYFPERELTEQEVKELNIRLNKNTGSWDFDKLNEFFEVEELVEWGFDEKDFKTGPDDVEQSFEASRFEVVVECKSEFDQEQVYNDLTEKGHKCRILTL